MNHHRLAHVRPPSIGAIGQRVHPRRQPSPNHSPGREWESRSDPTGRLSRAVLRVERAVSRSEGKLADRASLFENGALRLESCQRAEAARSNRAGRMAQPSCVASLVPAPSGAGLRVRRGGGMTRNQAGGVCLPSIGPVSRRRVVRLVGDLIEACLPCPTQPCPGRSLIDGGRLRDRVDGGNRRGHAQAVARRGGA
jgi:hypothetical protein